MLILVGHEIKLISFDAAGGPGYPKDNMKWKKA